MGISGISWGGVDGFTLGGRIGCTDPLGAAVAFSGDPLGAAVLETSVANNSSSCLSSSPKLSLNPGSVGMLVRRNMLFIKMESKLLRNMSMFVCLDLLIVIGERRHTTGMGECRQD